MASSILKLEASAGSGKTYRLALEYLGRLMLAFAGMGKRKIDPKWERELLGSILAITFTVKAAQEMKVRIVEQLKRFALSRGGEKLDKDDREFLRQLADKTKLDNKEIIVLSASLIELVLASYDDFNVMTIDSLMSAMVKAISPDLDLPADYEIAVDAGDEMETCGRTMLAALADSDWPRLERILKDFRRLNPNVAWKTDAAIIDKVVSLYRRTLQQKNANAALDSLRQRMADGWSHFRMQLRPLSLVMGEGPLKNGKCALLSGTYATDRLQRGIQEALEGGDDFPGLEALIGSTFFQKPDPDVLLLKKAPDDYRQRFSAAYRPAQETLRQAALDFSAFKTLPYRELLGGFGAAWKQGKKILFVEEFSHALAGLFEQWLTEAFPYLYLKLSDRFSSFLFDEFQDTSTLQFKALAPLIDEVLSRKESGSLFIVGDRKQAIYRWRGGNSELMDEDRLREEVPAIANLSPGGFSSTLGLNWRSRREIVDFNNRFWDPQQIARIAAGNDFQEAIRENFKDARQELPAGRDREGGYVELSLHGDVQNGGAEQASDGDAREDDDGALTSVHLDAIEGIIHRLQTEHGYDYSKIAVLVRKNDQVRSVIRRLGRRGIKSISDQSLLLNANARVAEIIAFLRFLDYPPDDLNFFSFISGRIFRAAAQQKFPREMKEFSEEAFIGCRGPWYKRFQEKFAGSWRDLIEPFFQSVGFLPPYDIFSDFTQVYGLFEGFPDDTPFFMALGDALHGAERDNGSSIAGFLGQWQRMVDNQETPSVTIAENTPGVRVLTMHQSKGLEFPAVIVPLNDRGGKGDDSLHWDEAGLFYINGEIAQAHPGLRARYEKENVRGSIDLLNLLYVAFTRAKEALFVPVAITKSIKAPDPAGNGMSKKISRASDIVGRHPLLEWFRDNPHLPFRRGRLEKKETQAAAGEQPAPIPSKKMLTRSWQSQYLVFERTGSKKRADRPGARRGERVHDLLSRLGQLGDRQDLDGRVRKLAAASGWPAGDSEAVASFLCRDDVFRLLSQGLAVNQEKEIVDNAGDIPRTLRFDRLQAGSDEVLIIDFKTGKEKEQEHAAQMRGYLVAAAPLFLGRRCRGYLLYIDRGEIEEVTCSS